MIDLQSTVAEADYRRTRALDEAARDGEIARLADPGRGEEEAVDRVPVLGLLIAALVAVVATAAIGPR